MTETVTLSSSSVRQRAVNTLRQHSVPDDFADQVAEVLLTADLLGEHSHGLICLAHYLERIRRGLIDPQAVPTVLTDADVLLALDANNGLGPVSAMDAALRTADRARRFGSCWVMLRNANHPGFLGYYSRMFAQRGLLGLVFMAGPQSETQTPLSAALPGNLEPIWFDASLDRHGAAPLSADAGMMTTVLSLISSVANGGAKQTNMHALDNVEGPAGLCFTMIAADSSRILERDDFAAALCEHRSQAVETNASEAGATDATQHFPGESQNERLAEQTENGLVFPATIWHDIDALLEEE